MNNPLWNAADAAALAAADATIAPGGGAMNGTQAAPAANGGIAQHSAAGVGPYHGAYVPPRLAS
ncbi:hypothetical protein [Burkholderia sp. AU30280]|uniref:hypothetical protein n=1 Tax=Burkholderia sp. AU30280 TaxID=2879628 RepID=UPI00299F1F63|nr:hypothetical protein [Burkholderia sp. AU30280]